MEAFGHDAGVNGYTPVAQGRTLCRHLRIGPGHRLLDIGTGRGWLGPHVAAELCPTEVTASASPETVTHRAGFTVVHREDVTQQFREGCEALLHAHTRLESALRAEEGDEARFPLSCCCISSPTDSPPGTTRSRVDVRSYCR